MNIYWWQVPDFWKTYVQEVDQEREMWLNSFYKAPLRLPMPSELEYWWSKGIKIFFRYRYDGSKSHLCFWFCFVFVFFLPNTY